MIKPLQTGTMRRSALIAVIFGTYLSMWPPSPASDSATLLEQVYKMGDFGAAAQLAGEITAVEPNNLSAHFYLANSLVKLGRLNEAAVEYKRCLVLGKGTYAETTARQALQALQPRAAGQKTATTNQPTTLNNEVERKRKSLLEAEARDKKIALERFDQEVRRIQQDAKSLGIDGKARTQAAFERYSAEENAIEQRYRREADEMLKTGRAMAERSRDEHASIRPVSSGSSYHVQNYEVLGDESQAVGIPSENPLTATPAKLDSPAGGYAAKQEAGKKKSSAASRSAR